MNAYGVNGVSSYSATEVQSTSKKETKKQTDESLLRTAKKTDETAAAEYKKSEVEVTGKRDTAVINRLKADAEQRMAQLRSLVEKMMTKQGQTYNNSTDMFALLRSGNLQVDAETAQQASKDIAQDGYWGVEQTSERLVSFAKALAGNDSSKADELLSAIEKGFQQATKAWGDELPDICKQTLEATRQKMKDWKEESL